MEFGTSLAQGHLSEWSIPDLQLRLAYVYFLADSIGNMAEGEGFESPDYL
jgi:hypothetical protein